MASHTTLPKGNDGLKKLFYIWHKNKYTILCVFYSVYEYDLTYVQSIFKSGLTYTGITRLKDLCS